MDHISDHDLERSYLGMTADTEEEAFEEHVLTCPECAERAMQTAEYIDAMRAAITAEMLKEIQNLKASIAQLEATVERLESALNPSRPSSGSKMNH